jgi:hypothetical protein
MKHTAIQLLGITEDVAMTARSSKYWTRFEI